MSYFWLLPLGEIIGLIAGIAGTYVAMKKQHQRKYRNSVTILGLSPQNMADLHTAQATGVKKLEIIVEGKDGKQIKIWQS